MSRNFKALTIAKPEDRRTLNALAADPLTTIDALHAWFVDRGLTISRGAVHNYARRMRAGSFVTELRKQLGGCTDAELRQQLAAWAMKLTGVALVSVAALAAFHANAGQREGGGSKAR